MVYAMQYAAGKEVTAGLMQEGHHVIMACRNMQRCRRSAIGIFVGFCLTIRALQLSYTLDDAWSCSELTCCTHLLQV